MSEQATVNAILQLLAARRIPAWHMRTGATKIDGRFVRFGAVGMADIIGILPLTGQFLAIEVKSKRGRVTPAQQAFLDTVGKAGGVAFVARSLADVSYLRGAP